MGLFKDIAFSVLKTLADESSYRRGRNDALRRAGKNTLFDPDGGSPHKDAEDKRLYNKGYDDALKESGR